MESEQKRLLMALVLSGAVLFTWQTYFAPKTAPIIEGTKKVVTSEKSMNKGSEKVITETTISDVPKEKIESQSISLSSNNNEITLSNDLMISNITMSGLSEKFADTIGEEGSLQILYVNGKNLVPFNFALTQTGNVINGVDQNLGVVLSANLKENGAFEWMLSSKNPIKIAFKIVSSPKNDASRQLRQFVDFGSEVTRTEIDDEESYEVPIKWLGLDYHYHLITNVFFNDIQAQVSIFDNTYVMKSVEGKREYSGFTTYLKKEYESLQKVGHKLDLSIDYGIFGIIAVPILKGLKFFYGLIPNYGIAIILVTLLIRMLLFPLQFKSFKSMKKMQKLQPQLQKIKEKHGDDPQKVQKDTMELFKKSGANPMSGCLPLLLQMPVFFAMYQVFLHSVELLGAPFAFWITDLSLKDPYYVLPALMGGAFFMQTKLNPSTTADPTQQKVMLIMPLIFPFMMKDLPAGLNLYMSVSTIFGIIQQMIVYKVIDD